MLDPIWYLETFFKHVILLEKKVIFKEMVAY